MSHPSGSTTLGLRPEHLVLGATGEDSLAAVAEFSDYLGGTRVLYARLAGGQSIAAEHREGPDVAPGETVHLRCPKERKRLFSGRDERLRRSGPGPALSWQRSAPARVADEAGIGSGR